MSRIFVAGTGRSGTDILKDLLGLHPQVHSFPREAKFIVECDGLIDLVDALTVRYTDSHAYMALERFDALMRHRLTGGDLSAFGHYRWADFVGPEVWYPTLNAFIKVLTAIDYSETVTPDQTHGGGYWPSSVVRGVHRTLPHYFSDRTLLVGLCRAFVDRLLMEPTRRAGRQTWCEKTPTNLVAMPFLFELFPDATVVHIKRDPRGVAHSTRQQSWAPRNIEGACLMLLGAYKRWSRIRESFPLTRYRYLEVRLEDLGTDPKGVLRAITDLAGLDPYADDIELPVEPNRADSWRRDMTKAERDLTERVLAEAFPLMGYDL